MLWNDVSVKSNIADPWCDIVFNSFINDNITCPSNHIKLQHLSFDDTDCRCISLYIKIYLYFVFHVHFQVVASETNNHCMPVKIHRTPARQCTQQQYCLAVSGHEQLNFRGWHQYIYTIGVSAAKSSHQVCQWVKHSITSI